MKRISLLALAAALAGCTAAVKDGSLVEPPVTGGKTDVADRVTLRGPLAFGEEAAVSGAFEEDLVFDGYTLSVGEGVVTLDVTQRGSSRGLDTTLAVYGPRTEAGGYGGAPLALDDDAGWGTLSRLRDLSLEAGEYLVVVGTYDARGRGRYRLEATCESGDCAPAPAGRCHPDLLAAVEACVADAMADGEWFYAATRRDLVEACANVEVIAPAFDALCASRGDALCDSSLEELDRDHLPGCLDAAYDATLDGQCVFGDRYRDLFGPTGAVIVISRETLEDPSALDAEQGAQVLAAVRHAYDDARDLADAFASVDEGRVNRVRLWDGSRRRPYVAYEYGAGDNSYGLVFEGATTTVAAQIGDGDLYGCTATWGEEMRICASDLDCAEGLRCQGVANGRGRCLDVRAPSPEGAEASCADASECGDGLVCQGASVFGAGLCRDAWLQGTFAGAVETPVPDEGSVSVPVVVYGLASVEVDVHLDLWVSHRRAGDLRVTLVNPGGTEVEVPTGDGFEIWLQGHPVIGFSGDEDVNGVWQVRVTDTARGETGVVHEARLTITSRWD